jgi:hypothetical protein
MPSADLTAPQFTNEEAAMAKPPVGPMVRFVRIVHL